LKHGNKQANRVALITGAARRIGASIARHLHQAGFRVIIHCHQSSQDAEKLAIELNTLRPKSACVIAADLTLKPEAIGLIAQALAWGQQLDLLVNNASLFYSSPQDIINDEQWDTLFTLNVKAPFWLSTTARPYLATQLGSIINITDIHADKPLKGYSVYCQSKAALAMQTLALAREFAPEVRVNAVAPGAIIWPEAANALNDEQQQKIIAKTPLKQHGDPVYIAQAVLALVENPFITGQTLRVDGGRSIL